DVGQGEMGCAALFGHLLETTAGQGDQSVKMEMTPLLQRRIGSVHDSPSWDCHATLAPSLALYEDPFRKGSFLRLFSSRRELLVVLLLLGGVAGVEPIANSLGQ